MNLKINTKYHKYNIDAVAPFAGAVFLYTNTGGGWNLPPQSIVPSVPSGSYFGVSVSFNNDGTLAVGANGYSKYRM